MVSPRRLGALATILRWLGPWSDGTRAPGGVLREIWTLRAGEPCGHRALGSAPQAGGERRLEAYLYRPERAPDEPLGVWLVAPGS